MSQSYATDRARAHAHAKSREAKGLRRPVPQAHVGERYYDAPEDELMRALTAYRAEFKKTFLQASDIFYVMTERLGYQKQKVAT